MVPALRSGLGRRSSLMEAAKHNATAFEPNAQNTRLLRDAFGQFATGITIVTAMSETAAVAITANSFTSVSLEPPIILWSVNKSSHRFPHFQQAKHFAVHVLASDQNDLCWQVAKDVTALNGLDYRTNQFGVPLIDNCLARFECETYTQHPAGDHELMLGRVLRAEQNENRKALTFFQGKVGTIAQGDI